MTASVEQRKQEYSKQLAEYTLRQWNIIRRESSIQSKEKPTTTTTPANGEKHGDENTSTDEQTTSSGRQRTGGRRGLHAIDFASRRSPKKPA